MTSIKRFGAMCSMLALGVISAATVCAEPLQVDENLKEYEKTSGISGNLSSVGSDTLNNLMALWTEQFTELYPSVNIQVEGKGSSTAPPALIEGTAQLGPMSRPMKNEEIEKFEDKYGFKPTPIVVALDALAVYVNKDNPIEKLSIPEIDAIFSKTRSCGFPETIETWGGVGLGGEWDQKPISIYGRNSASGTYGMFKQIALCKGDYKDTVKEQPGSASVVMGVTEDLAGIGYSGIGYKTSGVKAIAVSEELNGEAYEPTMEAVASENYPLGRGLFIYVAKEPGKPLDPMIHEFFKFVLAKEGQQIVIKDGYLPLGAETVQAQLKKLQ